MVNDISSLVFYYVFMKFLVINGHKYYPFAQGRLNKTLFDKIIELIKPNNEVQTTVVEDGYDLDTEINKFLWADTIIIQTPINWFSFPGMFKSYIDDVYKHGSFYGPSEEYGMGGLLKDKKYMYSLTWNSPCNAFSQYGEFYDGRSIDEVIIAMHKLQQYCGMHKIETFSCNDVVKHPDIQLFLERLEKHIKKYILEDVNL